MPLFSFFTILLAVLQCFALGHSGFIAMPDILLLSVANCVLKNIEAPDDIFFYKGFTFFFARKIKWGQAAIETAVIQDGL